MHARKHIANKVIAGRRISLFAGNSFVRIGMIIISTLIISSCAGFYLNLRTVSFTDEAFQSPKYEKIAVLGDFEDYFLVKSYEEAFSRVAYKEGIECRRATPIAPPTRQRTNDEIFSLLKEQSIEALVVIGFSREYQKISEIATETAVSSREIDDKVISEVDGFEKYASAYVKCRVFDVASGQLVWVANLGDDKGAISMRQLEQPQRITNVSLKLMLKLLDDEITRSTHPRRK